jgi:RNA ligase
MPSPVPDEIRTIEDIQTLTRAGFEDWTRYGEVTVRPGGMQRDLLIFNYTERAQYKGDWNFFERVSRGLILNRYSGEIVARAFDKFYNWLEGGRRSHGHIVTVTEKIDGSLGILYRDHGQYAISTRGSLISEQGVWATGFLNEHYALSDLPDELTLIFEIVYPENRIIIDYHGRRDLVLLTARNRFTGEYVPFFPVVYEMALRYGFSMPKVYQFNNLVQIIELTGTLDAHEEGFVVEFSDAQRFKFKGDRYLELNRLVTGLTYKNVLRAMLNNGLDEMLRVIPDEFLEETKGWIHDIEMARDTLHNEIGTAFNAIPTEARQSRKDFAIWVNHHHKALAPYLFGMLDGDDLMPMIYRALLAQKTDSTP